MKLKSFLRAVVDKYNCDIRLTGKQDVILAGIEPAAKTDVDAMMKQFGIPAIEEIDSFTRRSIACPAFPLCGLAQAEAERVMPSFNARMGALMEKMGMPGESFVMRMTGCPNGCARPYMAEVAFVGQGPNKYQVWLGGSPDQDGRTGWQWIDKMEASKMEEVLEPVFYMYKTQRNGADEAFGDFANRVGKDAINAFVAAYTPGTAYKDVKVEPAKPPMLAGSLGALDPPPSDSAAVSVRLSNGPRASTVRVTDEVSQMLHERADRENRKVADVVEELLMTSLSK
jgi:sulfite reductase (ferredoxin)